jgi:hypothetical protein
MSLINEVAICAKLICFAPSLLLFDSLLFCSLLALYQ